MIGLIVLGLAFVFFLVVAFFAAKTWHVGHVVAMAFLFLFTLVMLFLTATLFRTYEKFQPAYEKNIASLEQEQTKRATLLYGNPGEPAGAGSLNGEQLLARVEQFARGRVWRNVFGAVTPGNPEILLRTALWNNDGCLRVGQEEDLDEAIEPVADEAISGEDVAVEGDAVDVAAAPGPVNPHGILVGQFLYAFKEYPIGIMTPTEKEYYFGDLSDGEQNFADQDKGNRCRIPIVYLGKFRVTAQTDQSVTVIPESSLDQFQMQQIGNQASWVLYEKMPTDSHDLFAGVEPEKLAGLIPLKRLNDFGVKLSQQAYQAMLDQYARDGKEVTQPVNDPLRLGVEVRFKQADEVVVDLEVEGDLPETSQPYNVEGRAQIRTLMRGEPVKFAEGDVATFDDQTARRLIQEGVAEPVGNPTYSRQLRDFEYALNEHQSRSAQLANDLKSITADVNDLKASLTRLQDQVDKLRLDAQLLDQDLQGFAAERSKLFDYLQRLRNRRDYLESEIHRLTLAGGPAPAADPLVKR